MTVARARIRIEPMNLIWAAVAESVFRRSENWLRANIGDLRKKGFPAPDPRFDGLFNRPVESVQLQPMIERARTELDFEEGTRQ